MRERDMGISASPWSHMATPRHQSECDAVAAEQRNELAPPYIGYRFEDRLADQYEDGGEMRPFVIVITDERSASATFGVVGRSSPAVGRWAAITP